MPKKIAEENKLTFNRFEYDFIKYCGGINRITWSLVIEYQKEVKPELTKDQLRQLHRLRFLDKRFFNQNLQKI